MWANPTAVVGAFFLERTYRVAVLRIYKIFLNEDRTKHIATAWAVKSPAHSLPEEWHIRCELCRHPGGTVASRPVFATRERALRWLNMHVSVGHRTQHRERYGQGS